MGALGPAGFDGVFSICKVVNVCVGGILRVLIERCGLQKYSSTIDSLFSQFCFVVVFVKFNFETYYSEMSTAALGELPVCIVVYPGSDGNININLNVCTNKNKIGLGDIGG